MDHDDNKSKEKSPSLNNLDTDALQARIEKAQADLYASEETEALPTQEASDSNEIHRTIQRVAGRQLWIIVACVLMVLAAAAVLALQFGDLFSGGKNTDQTSSLTAGDAPWLSFADGMLSYNADYTGDTPAELIIPDTFDGNTVEGVADEGFAHMEEVVSVAVGENVPYIGVRAFEGCTELSQLNLGGVQEISYGAFDGCTSLTSVTGGRITTIGAYAFQDCDSLASFPLGEAVTTIGTCAFQNCSALGPDLLLPSAVSKIGQSAYEGCTSLLQIEVPDADSIGDSAFAGCTNLTFVQIDCLNVGNRALAECTALEGAAFGGKTLTLGTELFDGCTALTEVTYENEGTTLSEGAFQGCTSLAAPFLPAGTTEIPAKMFAGCTNLTDTGLTDRILSIGDSAYEGCTALTQVRISNNTDALGEGIFSGCTNLSEYTLPTGILEIPAYLFSGCTGLKSATVPESTQHIGEGAFQECTEISVVSIPYGVLSLGDSTFAGCTALQRITLPTSLESIGESTFAGCTSMQYLDIPKSVTWIGDRAFADMENLRSVGLFTTAQVSAANFPGCSALSEIRISGYDSLYSVIDGVLFSSDGKTLILYPAGLQNQSYTVPARVEQIETGAFQGTKLCRIHTGSTALIGMHAFADCSALQSVTLGEGLTELGFGAFQNCSALENVQLPHSLTTIDSMVFAGCTSLTQLTLPSEITDIASDAIENSTILWVEEDAPILDALKEAKLNYKVIPKSA